MAAWGARSDASSLGDLASGVVVRVGDGTCPEIQMDGERTDYLGDCWTAEGLWIGGTLVEDSAHTIEVVGELDGNAVDLVVDAVVEVDGYVDSEGYHDSVATSAWIRVEGGEAIHGLPDGEWVGETQLWQRENENGVRRGMYGCASVLTGPDGRTGDASVEVRWEVDPFGFNYGGWAAFEGNGSACVRWDEAGETTVEMTGAAAEPCGWPARRCEGAAADGRGCSLRHSRGVPVRWFVCGDAACNRLTHEYDRLWGGEAVPVADGIVDCREAWSYDAARTTIAPAPGRAPAYASPRGGSRRGPRAPPQLRACFAFNASTHSRNTRPRRVWSCTRARVGQVARSPSRMKRRSTAGVGFTTRFRSSSGRKRGWMTMSPP
jgi:hypothetical protein